MQLANARYNDASHTTFDVDVTIDGETFPFSYHPQDNAPVSCAIRDLLACQGLSIADHVVAPPALTPLTPRQIRLALAGAGLLDQVEAAINLLDEPTQSRLRIEWEYASTFERNNPLLLQIGAVLGLTSEQVDAVWLGALGL
jgi:hypothetical protein